MSVITGMMVFGGNIADILNYWSDIGVFNYVLPFLLIFAVVYGILGKAGIFGDAEKIKGINAVVAIAVGLLALQWDYVPLFFQRLFPYAGMGISVLLVFMILMGLFWKDFGEESKWDVGKIVFFILGAIIALLVIFNALADFTFTSQNWWQEYGPAIITLIIIGILIGLVVVGGKKGKT